MSETFALDEQVCFALYRASRATTAVYRPHLERLGVTYPQYLVLLALWERDARGVHDLCDALDLDTGTLSPLLKRLETAGSSNADGNAPTNAESSSTSPMPAPRCARRPRTSPAASRAQVGSTSTNWSRFETHSTA